MEKLGIIDDIAQWKEVRELRNVVNHEYEDDAEILFQALSNMVKIVPYLNDIHNKMRRFVSEAHAMY